MRYGCIDLSPGIHFAEKFLPIEGTVFHFLLLRKEKGPRRTSSIIRTILSQLR